MSYCLGSQTFFTTNTFTNYLCYCYRPQTSLGSQKNTHWWWQNWPSCTLGSLELDPFEWNVIHKDGHKHLNADAMSRCPADTGPTDQSSSCTPPASAQPDIRNSSPVSPSCSVNSIHFHNSSIPDPEPVSSNQTTPPPSLYLQRATRYVSSICVLQLPEDNLKKEQQDPCCC